MTAHLCGTPALLLACSSGAASCRTSRAAFGIYLTLCVGVQVYCGRVCVQEHSNTDSHFKEDVCSLFIFNDVNLFTSRVRYI